jgi:hypothetical protein
MSYIGRKKLETIDNQQVVKVEVPEWGGYVFMRRIKASEIMKYYETPTPASFLAYTLCDKDGQPEYTQDPKDLDLIDNKCGSVITRLFTEGLKISKLTTADETAREEKSCPPLCGENVSS